MQLLNGEYVIVEQVQHEILEAPVTVYNFEVEDFHTYYVSDSAILVHNNRIGVEAEALRRQMSSSLIYETVRYGFPPRK